MNILSRSKYAAVVALATALAASACSSSSKSSHDSRASMRLTITTQLAIHSLDGLVTNSYEINHVIFSGLTRLGTDGKVQADLASAWTSNADATQWTFTLRSGLKFSDGTPLTSADVLYSFNAVHDNKASLEHTYLTPMKAIASDGNSKIVFTLLQPDAIWARVITWIPIVSSAVYKAEGPMKFATAPIGAGPYAVVSYNGTDKVMLKANPHYWDTKPAISQVTMQFVADPTTRVNSLQAGQADATLLSGPAVATAQKAGFTVTSIPSSKVIWLGYNLGSSTISSLPLRQAVSAAINRSALVNRLLNGLGRPIGQLIPPTTTGYDPTIPVPAMDVAKAKQLVASSGYNGEPIPLTYPIGSFVPEVKQIAQAVASDLGAVGIKVELKGLAQETFLTDWIGKKIDGMFLMSIQNVLLDGGGNFQFLDTAVNTFTDADLLSTYNASLAETDAGKRNQLLSKISQINNDNEYYTPLFNDDFNYVYSKSFKLDAPASGYLLPQYFSPAS